MITYINTDDARELLREAKSIASDLRETINKTYQRLENVPDETEEWVGEKAIYYFGTIVRDKVPLEDFCDSIEKLNTQIDETMTKAEATIKG